MITDCSFRPEIDEESSCGSVVLAAVLEICCQEANMLMDLYAKKGWNGYTNVSHIRDVLTRKGIRMHKITRFDDMKYVPDFIQFVKPTALFIQLEGLWEELGWRSAYNYTHWVLLMGASAIDYNNRLSSEQKAPFWLRIPRWENETMQYLVDGTEGCTGWHIRGAYEFLKVVP